jgi:hypothetical protein
MRRRRSYPRDPHFITARYAGTCGSPPCGGRINVAEGWVAGPGVDKGDRWDPAELGDVIPELVADAAPQADMSGRRPSS